MMIYEFPQKVLFKHCDPAGIVFYPRYFEMMNDCIECFFAQALDFPFESFLPDIGVPTLKIETTFTAPSRHGDELVIALNVARVGNSSVTLTLRALCDGQERFVTQSTLVQVGPDTRPLPWPDHIKDRLNRYQETPHEP